MNKYWGYRELILDGFAGRACVSESSTSMNSISPFHTDICNPFNALIRKQLFKLSRKLATLN